MAATEKKAKRAAPAKPIPKPATPSQDDIRKVAARMSLVSSFNEVLRVSNLLETQIGSDIAAGVNARLNILCPQELCERVHRHAESQQGQR